MRQVCVHISSTVCCTYMSKMLCVFAGDCVGFCGVGVDPKLH